MIQQSGFSRRAGDRRFSPCTKVYHAGYKFWIHFIFGTTLNVSTKETKRFLLSAYKVLCKCRICSYKCCRFSKFPGGACPRTLLDDPPVTAILSPPTMPHLGEPCNSDLNLGLPQSKNIYCNATYHTLSFSFTINLFSCVFTRQLLAPPFPSS